MNVRAIAVPVTLCFLALVPAASEEQDDVYRTAHDVCRGDNHAGARAVAGYDVKRANDKITIRRGEKAVARFAYEGYENCVNQVVQSLSVGRQHEHSGPIPPDEREASRLFAGPHQYPPEDFAAYGIFAFHSRATTQDKARYLMFCEAYVATLLHASEVSPPRSQQMATVWPVDSDGVANRLNEAARQTVCDSAVDDYGLGIAAQALKDANQAKADVSDEGPFLLAWSPSTEKGKPGALVLVANLSNVTTSEEAKSRLLLWKQDILLDPKIWDKGWNVEALRIRIREWADQFGSRILTLFSGSQR